MNRCMQLAKTLRRTLIAAIAGIICGASAAGAFAITDTFEQVTISSVGTSFQTVTFSNTYTAPVAVCVGTIASNAQWPPVVRLQSVGSTSMQVRVQKFANATADTSSPAVNVAPVHCLIAEAGVHYYPGFTSGKVWFQAGKHTISNTFGNSAPNAWTPTAFNQGEVAVDGGLNGAYAQTPLTTTLVVLAQVMTSNDSFGQVAHVNDCENRANLPFLSSFSDGVCVVRHVGRLPTTGRAAETVGYLIFRTGAGQITTTKGTFDFSGGLSSNTVRSVVDNPPYTFSTTSHLDGAVATQQAEIGGDGSYAALYGAAPLAGTTISVALDESVNADRTHTTEYVAWLGFASKIATLAVTKTVDIVTTSAFPSLAYTINVTNTSLTPIVTALTPLTLTDTLTLGTATYAPTTGPTLNTSSDTGISGTLEAGETWTYAATYQVTEANYATDGGGTLTNNVTVTGSLITPQTASTVTNLELNPDLDITKTATLSGGSPIPATGASVGDVIEYTYTIRNDGNVPMSPVTISDAHLGLGAPLVFGSCTLTQDLQTQGNTTIGTSPFAIQSLAARDTVSCTATYTVVQADIDILQ